MKVIINQKTYYSNLKSINTYVSVGRSSYSALNRMNCVRKGSVSSAVPMAIALANVPMMATSLRIKSSIDTPLLAPYLGVEVEALEAIPSSRAPSFILPTEGNIATIEVDIEVSTKEYQVILELNVLDTRP